MDKTLLVEFNNIINDEIVSYNEIKVLYEKKKQILITHKVNELLNIDLEIKQKLKTIKQLSEKRKTMSYKLKDKDLNLTKLIELSCKSAPELCENFVCKKEQIQKLAKDIKVLEETNHELVKQGLSISTKIINTITAGAPTIPNNYDSAGKSKKNLELSLIEENI